MVVNMQDEATDRGSHMADNILATIEQFWVARLAGDTAAIHELLAPDATYEMVGGKSFADQTAVGPTTARAAAVELVGAFQFHRRDQLTAVVNGPRVATVSRVEVSFRGGPPVTSEVCDLWEFDGAGQIAALKQFVDTDLVRRMMSGQV